MPYSEEHKQRSRQKILKSALMLFTRKGFDKVSINEVMANAGMTRGAFYAHFKSKGELYAEAILAVTAGNDKNTRQGAMLTTLISGYLSRQHVNQERGACPLAFLATDIATRDDNVRDAYTKAYKGFVNLVNQQLPSKGNGANEGTALAFLALLIGGVAISRAINDDATIERILSACRHSAKQMIS